MRSRSRAVNPTGRGAGSSAILLQWSAKWARDAEAEVQKSDVLCWSNYFANGFLKNFGVPELAQNERRNIRYLSPFVLSWSKHSTFFLRSGAPRRVLQSVKSLGVVVKNFLHGGLTDLALVC